MNRQPARMLEPADVRRLLTHATGQRHHYRNIVIIRLSYEAGLRACEIAGLLLATLTMPSDRSPTGGPR